MFGLKYITFYITLPQEPIASDESEYDTSQEDTDDVPGNTAALNMPEPQAVSAHKPVSRIRDEGFEMVPLTEK